MKKYILSILLLLTYATIMVADPAPPYPIQVRQPDGTMLWTRLHGDEFYHWRSTADGHVLLRDVQQYYRYATIVGDSLVPSAILARNVEERTDAEKQFIQANSARVKQFIYAEHEVVRMNMLAEREADTDLPPRRKVIEPNDVVHGKLKVLTILMEFKDRRMIKTAADFERLMNQETGPVDGNMGSVRQFYKEDSYGHLDVSATVVGPYMANFKSSYYKRERGEGTQTTRELVREALHQASREVDFSTLDGDDDGYVDCVHIVFAGPGADHEADDVLIWPHQSQLVSAIIRDGTKAKQYIATPELGARNRLAPIGTICHELGHILGAPDYYDTYYKDDQDGKEYYATGDYDLMGNGNWNGYNNETLGRFPAHHNAYTKCYLFGWGTPEMITAKTASYKIPSSTISPRFYRIDTQTDGEFFLLENRIKRNFDQYIPNAGLVIYHIHKDLPDLIDKNKVNTEHPLRCYIVDASRDSNPTENPTSYGMWNSLRAFTNGACFTSTTTPSFTAWDGSPVGVDLCFIRQKGNDVVFTVNPTIQGPTQLCGTRTYSVFGAGTQDSVRWGYYQPNSTSFNLFRSPINFLNGKIGASVEITRGARQIYVRDDSIPTDQPPMVEEGEIKWSAPQADIPQIITDYYVGNVTIYATISSQNGEYHLEKEIEMPKSMTPFLPNQSSYPLFIWLVGQPRTLTELGCKEIEGEYLKWYVRYPNTTEEKVFTGRSITLTPQETGELTIRIVNECGCEIENEATYTYYVTKKFDPVEGVELLYPNPAVAPNLPVNIKFTSAGSESMNVSLCAAPASVPNVTYTLELWSDQLGRVCSVETDGMTAELDVAGLPTGWYQLLLLVDNQIITSGNVLITQ